MPLVPFFGSAQSKAYVACVRTCSGGRHPPWCGGASLQRLFRMGRPATSETMGRSTPSGPVIARSFTPPHREQPSERLLVCLVPKQLPLAGAAHAGATTCFRLPARAPRCRLLGDEFGASSATCWDLAAFPPHDSFLRLRRAEKARGRRLAPPSTQSSLSPARASRGLLGPSRASQGLARRRAAWGISERVAPWVGHSLPASSKCVCRCRCPSGNRS